MLQSANVKTANAAEEGYMLDNISHTFNEGFSKRYSFFEALEDKLLPKTKIEINFEIEKDDNLIWRAGGN